MAAFMFERIGRTAGKPAMRRSALQGDRKSAASSANTHSGPDDMLVIPQGKAQKGAKPGSAAPVEGSEDPARHGLSG